MFIRLLLLTTASLGLVLVYGCSSRDVVSPIYDTCFEVENCVPTADLCEELTVDFAGISYTNGICTVACALEGARAPGCPRAIIGRNGSCYPSSVGGGVDDTLICFEQCDVDGDCLCGFRCLGAGELCPGPSFPCPIADGDAICVPGPNGCFF